MAAAAIAIAGVAAISGEARTADAGTPAPASFRLADDSAACSLLASGSLACTATGKTVVLDADGKSRVSTDAVTWSDDTPVLGSSASWWHGAYSCRVADGAVACRTSDGAISVGKRRVGGVL